MLKRPPPLGGSFRYLAGISLAGATCLALYAGACAGLAPFPGAGAASPPPPPMSGGTMGVSYWIELLRNGKTYRCDDTFTFRSHDAIRLHLFANRDGYAYLVLRTGSKGGRALLFPSKSAGMKNSIQIGHECIVPDSSYVMFDSNPGVENVALIFSRHPLSTEGLVNGTRPPCCDTPRETILPRDLLIDNGFTYQDKELSFLLAKSSASLTVLKGTKPSDMLYADIDLAHE